MFTMKTVITGLAATTLAAAIPVSKRNAISVTPHDDYSSSIGVLGCKIDTNSVAYWPSSPSCDGMCVKVSANGRSVHLLQVDSSGGAYDISYNAWNYLLTGQSATADPQMGGGIASTYEKVPMSECADLIKTPSGKLAFSAANSMNFIGSCGADTWVGQNYVLFNIANPTCTLGVDEVCQLPPPSEGNQAQCPSGLGNMNKLTGDPVTNIIYGTGAKSIAQ